jgi:2,4-dienoyl-CoA reductase-like NADH-dependent reductase (Old Yellow Enzyme family)/thioredoxin reductase
MIQLKRLLSIYLSNLNFQGKMVMEKLFTPFRIKNCYFKNRIVMPGLASFLIENDGSITDKTIEPYRRRAAGGPAMVIMEACAVSSDGIVSLHQARIHEDRLIEGLSRIAAVMKAEGAIPAVQIHHSGRQTSPRVINRKPWAPSNLPCPTIHGEVEPLSVLGIQEIVQKFGDAAVRAVQAGFELLEIHGAHGYLINQFLSKFSNIRQDAYGAGLEGRARFAKEVIIEIRKRIGKEFPLSFKISAQEFLPDGLTTDESIEILKMLVPAGIDVVQVSAGNDGTPEWICQPMFMKKACLVDSASQIKKALNIPIMAVGRINDPLLADQIIKNNQADLVCMGRGLLADPELPKKAQEGRLSDIRICIACNTCMESIFRKGQVECLVNPVLGHEKEMEMQPAQKLKKVMVVGGGPGGLNVAWVAAKRGHDVHLYEKSPVLGGQLNLGSITQYKKELLSLINFQKHQIEKFGVKTYLNTEVNLGQIKACNPDVIVLATGSLPNRPALEGMDKPIVFTLPEVLNGKRPKMKKCVVIGGGASGCEVAHHLAANDCSVTVIEQLPKIAEQMETITRKVLLRELKTLKVTLRTECRLVRIEDQGARVRDKEGREFLLEADAVIIAIGNKPDNALYDQVQSLGIPVHRIGDCIEPRSAKAAIYEGAVIGRRI